MPPALDNDDNLDTHEWKSEFASTRSGRNSPNIFAKVRRKLLLTPPVRNARSPRLTEEELDALTGDLPYATNYTYAYSKIYDPSLPDHWEVPNLAGGGSSGMLAEQEHWSAASLSRQLLYILRFPIYLIVHVITYILEAFYHLVKLFTFTLWDYILYLIKSARNWYATYQDNRRRTALVRNRQDPFRVKAANFIRRFFEIIFYIVSTPVRMFSKNAGVEQYEYKSIKDQLQNERASRMTTRSQTLERSRRFEGLSQSPSRNGTPASSKTSTVTRITTRVFSGVGASDKNTPIVVRTVKERSVTPRFHNTRSTKNQGANNVFDSSDVELDSPLVTYGLRSRGQSHVNTPEPTFDIGRVVTSTPLMPRNIDKSLYVHEEGNKVQTIITWIGYIILFPFFAARHIWYIIYDYGRSAYMKVTNYQQAPMETIYVRDADEPAPVGSYSSGLVYVPWTSRVYNFFESFFSAIKESHQIVFAVLSGVAKDTFSYGSSLVRGLYDKKSSRFSGCHILGLLLALLLALFLFGFFTSDNTAIRVKKFEKDTEMSKSSENALPDVPFYMTAGNHVKNYVWMVKEFAKDIVFDTYNYGKSVVGRTSTAPKFAWDLIVSGFGAFYSTCETILSSVGQFTGNIWHFFTGGFTNAMKSVGQTLYGAYDGLGAEIVSLVKTTYAIIYNIGAEALKVIASIGSGLLTFCSESLYFVGNTFKSITYGISDWFYNYIYSPFTAFFTYITKNHMYVLQQIGSATRGIYDSAVSGITTIINWACFLVTYPFALATRAWIKISQYAPEDVVQVIPIPQAVTPTPDVERIVEQPDSSVDTLKKRDEIGDGELKIVPAPAPERIPVPAPTPDPIPNIIHQTKTIDTVPIPKPINPTLNVDQPKINVDPLKKRNEIGDEELVINPAPTPDRIPPIPNIIHQTKVIETVDKSAIIQEVTEKLRAELSAQFQQELSAKLEHNHNIIIEKLKGLNINTQFDNNQLEAMIRQLIYEYDTDKTGKVDYALESGGGAVISTRCSETYKSYTRLEKFWDIPLYYFHYTPRVVIQRNSKSLFPGECWCFKDGRGYIAVELSHHIDVSSISYEHIGKEVAPEGNRTSAPKGVLVWAYKQIDDLNSRVLIGDYIYDLEGPPLQYFIAKHKPDFPVKFVELEVTSNYGAPFTCLYRLRVHGRMLSV